MINPSDYRQDTHGNLVPIENIKEVDLLRDQVVIDMLKDVKTLRAEMANKKEAFFKNFRAFVELSAEKYNVKLGGRKGNTTLYSFDGKYKVEFHINERMELDERINAAKALIDECINDWATDSNRNIITLINRAFRVDKQGNININRILELRTVEIEDERWRRAMEAISDSVRVTDSKEYLRFYERLDNGQYVHLSLDFAAI